METEKSSRNDTPTTFDEASMESSKSFVAALQELKNLRPQLYSAADYCEKSYLHSEQKQMVLDNLKDYAVRALVNAVDHLGTVASKLTDVFERQNLDISTMDFKVSCLSQQILTCIAYMDTEGLRQQELLAIIPRHHKHYILPNSVSRRVHFSPLRQADARQNHYQAISRLQPSDSPASKSLSWHLGSGNNSTSKGNSSGVTSLKDERTNFTKTSGVFHLLGGEETINQRTLGDPTQLPGKGGMAITMRMQNFGATHKDLEGTNPLITNKPTDKPRQEIIRASIRNKSVLSSFFVKQKTAKLRAGYVS